MKTARWNIVWLVAAVLAAGTSSAQAREKKAKGAKQEAAPQSSSTSVSTGGGISVRTVNGQTTVTYKGVEVFSGQTSGMVSARSSNVNGTEYAAALEGDKVLWENVSGAADQVKSMPKSDLPAGLALPGAEQQPKKMKTAKKRLADV